MSSESLQTLFSDSTKNNFARLFKPAEFAKKKKIQEGENSQPAKKKKKLKHKHRDKDADATKINGDDVSTNNEKDQRTCFVGNISTTENKKSIIKFFKEFGEIESVRLRSVPVEGTAVDEDGNQNLVKKVCSNKQKFGDQKGSFNAYVVYKEVSYVESAISAANNQVFGGRHLRVDHCIPSVLEPKRTVFLGSVPFYADEEELRNHFAAALAGGHDDIDTVRIIRDPDTLVGKGIAYISLKNHDAVMKALTLDQTKFQKRKIRVSTCGKRTKRSQQRFGASSSRSAAVSGPPEPAASLVHNAVAGKATSCSSSKKRKREGGLQTADAPGARRILMKKSLARQAAAAVRGKAAPNSNKKKGKLGGVIKTAIKKAKNLKK